MFAIIYLVNCSKKYQIELDNLPKYKIKPMLQIMKYICIQEINLWYSTRLFVIELGIFVQAGKQILNTTIVQTKIQIGTAITLHPTTTKLKKQEMEK